MHAQFPESSTVSFLIKLPSKEMRGPWLNPISTDLKETHSLCTPKSPGVRSSWIQWLKCSHQDLELLIPWFCFFHSGFRLRLHMGLPAPPALRHFPCWQSQQKSSFYFPLPSQISAWSLIGWLDRVSIPGAGQRFWPLPSHRVWEWSGMILKNAISRTRGLGD